MAKLKMGRRWKEVRRLAIARDEHQCLKCHHTKSLSVHHIHPKSLYPELRFTLSNLATLCLNCHKIIHDLVPLARMQPGTGYFEKWLKNK